MNEPTYYQLCPDGEPFDDIENCTTCDGLGFVPVEPDYEAMVEAGRKANIDLVPEECEMLFRAGIGGDDE